MADHGLIVDVGMHRGEDTEFYLAKGFRVLAIEADPQLVAETSHRLAGPIADGRLDIVHAAVADEVGEVTFYASGEAGWGSLSNERGDALSVDTRPMTVPATTLDVLLDGRETPHFIKVDIEGADAVAIRAISRLRQLPNYVSFECDLRDQQTTLGLLTTLGELGYRKFKLINQAGNPTVRCPYPPREGDFVDITFSHLMSGPFGEESPGPWLTLAAVQDKYLQVARSQAVRASYSESGRVLGIPVGRFHGLLRWIYHAPPVAQARKRWATWRGVEMGGWFDVHAAL